MGCTAGTILDLSLTATLPGGSGGTTLPARTIVCVSATGLVLGEVLPSGATASVVLILDSLPTGTPAACPAGSVIALVASGTAPPVLVTPIGSTGICVHT